MEGGPGDTVRHLVGVRSTLNALVVGGLMWLIPVLGVVTGQITAPSIVAIAGVMWVWVTANLVGFFRISRRWRFDSDTAYVPGVLNPERTVGTHLLGSATYRRALGSATARLEWPDDITSADLEDLYLNMFVVASDVRRWLAAASAASNALLGEH